MKRHAEIAGAGFGGLVAAIALAERGWSVRVHEKTPLLRAEGFGIAMLPNMLKVLETCGVRDEVLAGGVEIKRREVLDQHGRPVMVIATGFGHRVSRQHILGALARRAAALGVEVCVGSEVTGAEAAGVLILRDGQRLAADLVVGADGIYSTVRDALGLLASRRPHPDGAMRMVVAMSPEEARADLEHGPTTREAWSGARRLFTSPCSASELYIALTCLASDTDASAMPLDAAAWARSFPARAPLFERIRAESDWSRVRWARFETVRLKRWSAGRVAVLGDAAHAMSPNLGQGAGCAMMNALALAFHLNSNSEIETGLSTWEEQERPLTEHTQRWAGIYGSFTTWPAPLRSLALKAMGETKWLRSRYQRTSNHVPTGYRSLAEQRSSS